MGKSKQKNQLLKEFNKSNKSKKTNLLNTISENKYGPISIPDLEANLFDTSGKIIKGKIFKFNINIPRGYTIIKTGCNETFYMSFSNLLSWNSLKITKEKGFDIEGRPCVDINYGNNVIELSGLMLNSDKSCKTCTGSSYMMVAYNVLQLLIKRKAINPIKMQLVDLATKEISTKDKPYTTGAILQMFGIKSSVYNYNLTSYNLAVNYRTFYEAYGFVPVIILTNGNGVILDKLEPYNHKYVTYFHELVKKRKYLLDRKLGDYTKIIGTEASYKEFWKVSEDVYIYYLWTYSQFSKVINSAIAKLFNNEKYRDNYLNYTLKELIYKSVKDENNNKIGLSMAHDLLPMNSMLTEIIADIYGIGKHVVYYYPARELIPKILAIYKANEIDIYEAYYSIIDIPLNFKLPLNHLTP